MNNDRSILSQKSSHGRSDSVDTNPSLRILSAAIGPSSPVCSHEHAHGGPCSCPAPSAVGRPGSGPGRGRDGPPAPSLGLTTEFPAALEKSESYERLEEEPPWVEALNAGFEPYVPGESEEKLKRKDGFEGFEPHIKRFDPETGEIIEFKLIDSSGTYKSFRDAMEVRLDRWCLHEAAREILEPTGHRTTKCMRQLLSSLVGVHTNKELTSASFSGVMVCGSVWTCPICAARITERRRQEVRLAIAQHEKIGGAVIMATRTFPHYDFDNLKDLMGRLTEADGSFKQHRRFKKIRKKYGIIGYIRALEVTYGWLHGWHPHFHDLLFLERALTAEQWRELEYELYVLWCDMAHSAGLGMPDAAHGLRLDDARLYVSKWGCDHELTKQHIKTSRDGYTPWQILHEYSRSKDEKWADLFREYMRAFRKKHQLQWSKGLKKHFKIKELTDKQILNNSEDTQLVCILSREQWYTVVRHNAQGDILALALTGGAEAIFRCIAELEKRGKGGPLRDPPSVFRKPTEFKPAQAGKSVRVECVMCKVVWQSYEPGVHMCPECGSHWYARVMYRV